MASYQQVTKDGAAATKGLMMIWEKLGKPEDCSVNTGWILLDNIVQVWMKYFPDEVADFKERLKVELDTERDVHAAIKDDGGYFPVTFPPRLMGLTKTLLPNQKLNGKKFMKQFTTRYPLFKSTNYKL